MSTPKNFPLPLDCIHMFDPSRKTTTAVPPKTIRKKKFDILIRIGQISLKPSAKPKTINTPPAILAILFILSGKGRCDLANLGYILKYTVKR